MGYNPHKPGRPSHTYHTYLIANLRLVLDVEVQAGEQSHSSHSLPGLLRLLDSLPAECRPTFTRGDCDWGNEGVMSKFDERGYGYLFKIKKSKRVKQLIHQLHGAGEWQACGVGWEGKESELQLMGWSRQRRVIVIRRQVVRHDRDLLALENTANGQQSLAFIDGPEDMKTYEYAVLVTNLQACRYLGIDLDHPWSKSPRTTRQLFDRDRPVSGTMALKAPCVGLPQ